MVDEKKSGGGWGWFWLILVIAIIGVGYLYQRDGGKIFGPEGIGKDMLQKIYGLEIRYLGGNLFDYHYSLKNGTATDLYETKITLILYREDGEKTTITKYWAGWKQGEEKEFKIPRHTYEKMVLQGKAIRGSENVMLQESWTFGKK
jgi:hypothetical protein